MAERRAASGGLRAQAGPWRRSPPAYSSSHATTLHSVIMVPPMHQERKLEHEKDVKVYDTSAKGTSLQHPLSKCTMKSKYLPWKENKGHAALSPEVSVDKKPMDETGYAVQNTGEGNGSASKESSARLRLNTVCDAIGWKDPLYEFEEQGPLHNKLFTCKVTIHVDIITNTVVECFSEPKRQKKSAQEHAAQGVLWYLKRFGRAN